MKNKPTSLPDPGKSPTNFGASRGGRPADPPPTLDLAQSEGLVQLLDQYLEDLKAGRSVDAARLVAEHPDLAEPLQACLAGLEFIQQAGGQQAGGQQAGGQGAGRHLGGFRIVREVGRGGMGAVYEAQDLTLGRRVALKVLHFGPVADREARERFQREAETVAGLHHTNIVPIYSVGEEEGVHFYAMQFIEGRSLADVARQANRPLPATEVAQWGLEAAEALEHAHRRGVIHRDVKPSNLLLDRENRIWLTDFGLARRLDDATLSMTGALLGTPRYMSPEQASAAGRQVDQRTDIYSLGATLFELATGRPVFPGDSPHAVLADILAREPDAARTIHPHVPRDLETILGKCLAKDPDRRYATAGELAEDLRAFLEGRSIRARRAGVLEKSVRWARRHKQNLTLTGLSVAATLALVLLAVLGGRTWSDWHRAWLLPRTGPSPLIAQVVDNAGRPVSDKRTLPAQEPFEVPAGMYQLRVEGDARLSQEFRFQLPAGDRVEYQLDLEDQLLWRTPVSRDYLPVAGVPGNWVLLLDEDGIRLLQGDDGRILWTLPLVRDRLSNIPDAAGLRWPWNMGPQTSARGHHDLRPRALAVDDLDGDAHPDLVLAARHQAWVLAVSGRSGQLLWSAVRDEEVRQRPEQAPWLHDEQSLSSTVLSPPAALPDINGDGVCELLLTLAAVSGPEAGRSGQAVSGETEVAARRWVEAVSGRDGSPLWTWEPDSAWFEMAGQQEVPQEFRWFVGRERSVAPRLQGESSIRQIYQRRIERYDRPRGSFVYVPGTAQLVDSGRGFQVRVIAGDRLCLLDPARGTLLEPPQQLPTRPGAAGQWIDADRDGDPELVCLTELPPPRPTAEPLAQLCVWSVGQRRLLWQQPLNATLPRRPVSHAEPPRWPLVTDLDGDDLPEVICPVHKLDAATGLDQVPWGELEVRELASGRRRWSRRLPHAGPQLDRFVTGPDVDGDGAREVFAIGLWGEDGRLYVDALSGADGRVLWTNHTDAGDVSFAKPWPGQPWIGNESADGWPQLFVPVQYDGNAAGTARLVCFSTGSGQLTCTATGIAEATVRDLDGDGVSELLAYRPANHLAFSAGGSLEALRSVRREAWRWLGTPWQPLADLDGDGVLDLMATWQDGSVHALSGESGRLLWTTRIRNFEGRYSQVIVPTATGGSGSLADADAGTQPVFDLDGDGLRDVLVCVSQGGKGRLAPLRALSGATGRTLWTAGFHVQSMRDVAMLAARDLDGDGNLELVCVLAADWEPAAATAPGGSTRSAVARAAAPVLGQHQLWAVVLEGRSGRLRWRQQMLPEPDTRGDIDVDYQLGTYLPQATDCNGDGVLDPLLPAVNLESDRVEMRALDGRSGKVLWSHVLPPTSDSRRLRNTPPPLVCDLDGDGLDEIYQLAYEDRSQADGATRRTARLRALTPSQGKLVWEWETEVSEYCGRLDSSPQKLLHRPRAQRLRQADGPDLLLVGLWGATGQVFVLDHRGQVTGRREAKSNRDSFHVHCRDVDGDGSDELVLIDNQRVVACPGSSPQEALWEYSLPGLGIHAIQAVWQELTGQSPTVVVAVGSPRNQLLGLDGASGRPRWICAGPLPRVSGAWLAMSDLQVLGPSPGRPAPLVFFQYMQTSVCREASAAAGVAAAPGVALEGERATARQVAAAPVSRGRVRRDERLLRPLPWVPAAPIDWRGGLAWGIWTGWFGIALLALPGGYLFVLARSRRWGLGSLAAAPAVAAVALLAVLSEPPHPELAHPAARLLAGLAALPVLLSLGLLARWLIGHHGRRLLLPAGLLIVATVGLAATALWFDGRSSDAALRYRGDGWYWILLPAAYATCWLLPGAVLLVALAQRVRSWWRGRRA